MYKKSILSVAIASSLMLTGCFENNKLDDENEGSLTNPPVTSTSGSAYPAFNPAVSDLPIPNDLIFDSEAGDGTFAVPISDPAVTPALNQLSGASTVAPIDIKILSGEVDANTLDGNVYLLELAYASGSPVQGLSLGEPPTVAGAANVALEHKVLDGNSYIRINPKTPLKPQTRYEVVITNGVKDTLGNPLVRNPGVASYAALSDLTIPLANPALEAVQTLINRVWEPTALAFFDLAVNPTRVANNLEPLGDSNIILTYTLTTSGDEKVLNYIADPAQWFDDQLTASLRVKAAKTVVGFKSDEDADVQEDYSPTGADYDAMFYGDITADGINSGTDGEVNYLDVKYAADKFVENFPSAQVQALLDTKNLTLANIQSVPGCNAVTNGATYISCMSAVLGSPLSPFAALLPTPTSTSITFDENGALDINQVSSLTGSLGIAPGTVSVVQGEMTIPYYAGVPAGANGAPLITDSWVADDTLATAINSAFAPLGLQIPQADPTVSTAVNYIFPFPKKKADVTIPVLGIHPTNPAGTMSSVMYQHGITTDRSAALAFGAKMVEGAKNFGGVGLGPDIGVIAIDQPLHGIDGISEAEQKGLAETLLSSAGILTSPDGVFDGQDSDEQATIDGVVAGLFSAGLVDTINTITNSGAPGTTSCVDLATNGLETTTLSIKGGACDADLIVSGALGNPASATVIGAEILERTVANGASTISGLATVNTDSGLVNGAVSERHFGFTSAGAGVAPNTMDYSGSSAANASGSMFINLTSFLTSRDNVRQQVLDLLAVRKSLGTVDVNGASANGDMSDSDVYFIGHSLGTINGLPFVAVANDSATPSDDIKAANMLTPGSGITRLLENSPSFSGPILTGLAGLGLTQDTSSFQAYMNVLQGALDSSDPANFIGDLDSDSILFSLVVDDATISNSLDSEGEVLGQGSIAYMSGSEPLVDLLNATQLTEDGQSALGQLSVRYKSEGGKVNHGTPVFPSTGTAEESAAFAEMVGQATSMVISSGTGISVDNDQVLEGSTPPI